MSDAQAEAIDVARQLIRAGVPLFLARPARKGGDWDPTGGTGGSGYWLPRAWETSTPRETTIDNWQTGMGLGAVMGHVCDGLDVDPRNGGDESVKHLPVPTLYGVQSTPSGGWHGLMPTLHAGSRDGVAAGVDIKGGRLDGSGRGFLWIAPTVKLSKATGEIAEYTWTTTPDLTGIASDTSAGPLGDFVTMLRTPRTAPGAVSGRATPAKAGRILMGLVAFVLRAPQGQRNTCLNWAAWRAGQHAQDGILDRDQAEAALTEAAHFVGLDPVEIANTLASARKATGGGG